MRQKGGLCRRRTLASVVSKRRSGETFLMLIVDWVAPQKVSRVKIDIYAPLKSETTRKTLAQVKGRAALYNIGHIESLDHNVMIESRSMSSGRRISQWMVSAYISHSMSNSGCINREMSWMGWINPR
jgi:hypothetical protein